MDWLNVFNTSCETRIAEPDEEACPNAFQIDLITREFIESHNSDSLLVKRLLGHLYLAPIGFQSMAAIAAQANYMRVALKRWETPGGAQNPPIYNPLLGDDVLNAAAPDDQGDFSEMGAIHQWEHFFDQEVSVGEQANFTIPVWHPHLEDCAGVGTEFCVQSEALTDGSGRTWNSGPGGTGQLPMRLNGDLTCETCEGTQGNNVFGAPKVWHMPINLKFRKGIRLHERMNLSLFFGWENLSVTGLPRQDQQFFLYLGGIRALVET